MKLIPSATARRSTLSACGRSLGSPQMSSLSISRMAPKPRRLTLRSPILSCKLTQHPSEAERHARKTLVVELLRRVARQMVMRIAVEGRVRHHHRRIAVAPERPVVRPSDARNERGCSDAFRWELPVFAEEGNRLSDQAARAQVADESDEVGAVGIEQAERRRVALAAGGVAVVAEHFEREHGAQLLAALARAA